MYQDHREAVSIEGGVEYDLAKLLKACCQPLEPVIYQPYKTDCTQELDKFGC